MNQTGVLMIKTTKAFGESTASKIIDLVENASSRKAPKENFITTFARYYTPVVVILAAFLAILPPIILGGGWTEWIRRGFVFLVVSCPCALVISIPLTFFGGIGAASKRGVLVKGSNYYRHRWVGRTYRGDRVNHGQGTRHNGPVTSGEGVPART